MEVVVEGARAETTGVLSGHSSLFWVSVTGVIAIVFRTVDAMDGCSTNDCILAACGKTHTHTEREREREEKEGVREYGLGVILVITEIGKPVLSTSLVLS